MASGHKGAVLRQIHRVFSSGTVSAMSEEQLLERFVALNDKAAFEAIVVRHGPMVWSVCRRVLTNPLAAEDAFQATFLVLLKKAGSLRDPGRLSPWLYGVALRVATRARADAARRSTRERDAAKAEAVDPVVVDDLGRIRAVIDEEIGRLPERYRRPVVLCHLEGKSYEEAARQLCWTEGMVRGRLARAREKLRTGLTRRGLAPSAALITAALSAAPASATMPTSLVAATLAIARIVTLGGTMTTITTLGPILKLAEGVLSAMLLSKLKLTATVAAIGAVILTALPIALAYDEKPKSRADKTRQDTKLQTPPDRAVDLVPKANTVTRRRELRVVDRRTGEPLRDVTLGIAINDQPEIEGKTDQEGHYSFELPQEDPKSLRIRARIDGFVPASMVWGLQRPGAVLIPKSLQFMMEPGTSIGGMVQNSEGRPIEGANVFLLLPSKPDETQQRTDIWDYPVKTDHQGRWRCDVMPPNLDDLGIRLQHPDYISDTHFGSTTRPTMARLRDQTGVMVMKKGLPVSGRVFDDHGRPISGARVAQGASRAAHEPEVKTDAEGRFKFDQVAPGELILTAQAAGRAPDLKTVKVTPRLSPVEFRLEPGHVVRGRVVDPEGKPVAGVWIVTDGWRGHRSLVLEAKSQADGSFQVADAPADTVLFQFAKSPEFRNLPDQPLPATDEWHVVKMIRPVTIRGSVVDSESGEPIETFTVFRGDDPKGESPRWRRDRPLRFSRGRYEVSFDWPYPSVQGLRVDAEGYLPAISRGFSVTGSNQVYDFKLTRGKVPTRPALTGVVRLPDGSPAADVEIALATKSRGIYVKNGTYTPSSEFPTVRTGIDGRFAFPPQTEAGIVIVLNDRGFAQVTEEQLIAADAVTLTPWGRVEGTLRIGDKPGAFEEVTLSPTTQSQSNDQWISYHYNVGTDASGQFVLSRVIPGAASMARRIKLSSSYHGFGPSFPILIEAGQTVQITIGGKGRPVTGRVIPLTGSKTPFESMRGRNSLRLQAPHIPMPEGLTREQRIDWYNVWIVTEGAEAYREYQQRSDHSYPVKVERDGTFRIEDVAPGTYELSLRFDQSDRPVAEASRTVTVPEIQGGRSDVPIELGELNLIPWESGE